MKKIWLMMLLSCMAVSFVQAQSKPDSALSGRVSLEDGQPAAGAYVEVSPVGTRGSSQTIYCDEAGNFKLTGLSPGAYSIEVSAPGYVMDRSVQSDGIYRLGETASIRMVKGGVITGRVTDLTGEPLAGIGIKLQRLRDLEGNRVAGRNSPWWNEEIETDDRGVYRAYGLEPGVYVVGVDASSGFGWQWLNAARDVPTWFPSTTREAAAEITIRSGDELSGIDIRHRGDPGHAISGTVSGEIESSQPFTRVGLTLLSAATKEIFSFTDTTNSNGFVFFGLPDGDYELYAWLSGGKDENGSGSPPRHVTIKGTDVTGINLKLVKFGSIAGRVVIEPAKTTDSTATCDSKSRPAIEEILVQAHSDGRNPRTVNALNAAHDGEDAERRIAPGEKGEFVLKALEPDTYWIKADLPGERWYIRSVSLPSQPGQSASQPGGQAAGGKAKKVDAVRSPITLKPGERLSGIEINIADGAASLSGKVVSAKEAGNLPTRLRVHLIPAEGTASDDVLRYREAMAGKDGSFDFKQLAPGKYWLLARAASENEANPDKLRPAAFDPIQRTQLRREAEAAKNELVLQPCSRVKDHKLRF